MIIHYIQKRRNKTIAFHLLLILPLLIAYSLSLIYLSVDHRLIHITFLLLITIVLTSFGIKMHQIKNTLKHKKIKMHQEFFMIPYPQKFIDHMVEVGEIFKSYRHRKHWIPDYFIEFREGRTLYLYPLVQGITNESYTILKVNKFQLALVLDESNKKRIIHLGNAKLID